MGQEEKEQAEPEHHLAEGAGQGLASPFPDPPKAQRRHLNSAITNTWIHFSSAGCALAPSNPGNRIQSSKDRAATVFAAYRIPLISDLSHAKEELIKKTKVTLETWGKDSKL